MYRKSFADRCITDTIWTHSRQVKNQFTNWKKAAVDVTTKLIGKGLARIRKSKKLKLGRKKKWNKGDNKEIYMKKSLKTLYIIHVFECYISIKLDTIF